MMDGDNVFLTDLVVYLRLFQVWLMECRWFLLFFHLPSHLQVHALTWGLYSSYPAMQDKLFPLNDGTLMCLTTFSRPSFHSSGAEYTRLAFQYKLALSTALSSQHKPGNYITYQVYSKLIVEKWIFHQQMNNGHRKEVISDWKYCCITFVCLQLLKREALGIFF